ncbi:HAD family hydrolase [Mangrovicella endophytica]|uniref:HAD family hydrolase n=1 Tax=Mangrovicella endophytica TaxID=2066697 RepID=UPI0012FFD6A8|nr:HAD family hydrolase [Mangrovicella endophytica]
MTNLHRRKRLVLLDLDGVIIDSRHNMELAWTGVQRELGISIPFSRYFAEIGRPFADIMARIGLADQAGQVEATYRRVSSQQISDAPLFDGIEAFLRNAARTGVKLGIVTSKDGARTQLVLDRIPVSFAVVMTPGGGLRGKPAPDPLLYAMAQTNTDPAETIFVGDMDSDAEAARRAGLDYVHVEWGYGGMPEYRTASVATPADLTSLLFA